MLAILVPAHSTAVLDALRLTLAILGVKREDWEVELFASMIAGEFVHGRTRGANALGIHRAFRMASVEPLTIAGYLALADDISRRIESLETQTASAQTV